MPDRVRRDELRALREESRRHGRQAAERSPFSTSAPPEDLRPLSGLPMPRGLPVEVLTGNEITAISEAWLAGWRQVMAEREAGGEVEQRGPTLWWSPAVPGGWREGWRYQQPGTRWASSTGPLSGDSLAREASDAQVRDAAESGGAPAREGTDWRNATVQRQESKD